MLQADSIGMLEVVWHYTVGTGTQAPVATFWDLFTSVATGHYVASLNINFTLLCRNFFVIWLEKNNRKKFFKFRRKYQDLGGLKNPSFPAFLNLLTWDALPLPPNKCSWQLKHFVEGQNLPRRLVDKFGWQYNNCHIPMISAASLRQDKVLGRGDTRVGGGEGDIASINVFYLWKMLSLIFIFPNDMPEMRMLRWICGVVKDRDEIRNEHARGSVTVAGRRRAHTKKNDRCTSTRKETERKTDN